MLTKSVTTNVIVIVDINFLGNTALHLTTSSRPVLTLSVTELPGNNPSKKLLNPFPHSMYVSRELIVTQD